ncbi:hypothetical protein A3A71_01890 [Candidatus Berkelbacteria bacterium RIFCSPLOWO2_01_FULL_50_28]|uniref:Uncharacterized protein n=1 Tax=Candidatus Berkelbacteria bacterium RIFCSPLOWO2_01_FULL_50_28 TaxID=1797471 RepID=A0A1F5EBI9_9BACT|nr:MAG: hypothetical protein A3F39_00145 [Candidatus Berkelbacteria bacterium RIFCSPHIGHO2_12_FULL_50_11]OGD64778.1 MAG: hypothetical protein A3A71_01890 [Candidatus Berkelbacteria bacterium RIFCSPLOWO2_01_FULL_50_28]
MNFTRFRAVDVCIIATYCRYNRVKGGDLETQARPEAPRQTGEIASLAAGKRVIDTFGSIIFFVVVIEIIVLIGLNAFQRSQISATTEKLNGKKGELAQVANQKINTQIEDVLNGYEALDSALSSKVKWSNFYDKLGAVTPRNIWFSTISVSEGGTFRADGFAPSLSGLARGLVAWQSGKNTPLSDVALVSNGFVTQGSSRLVGFSIAGTISTGSLNE